MNKFEVMDQIREHVGRDKVSDTSLAWCLDRGLREIEKHGNFYWMEASKVFDLMADNQEYSIANDMLIDDFKDARLFLVSDRSAVDPRWCQVVGPEPVEDVKVNFTESDSGTPAFWSLREDGDPTLLVWPPMPDQDYRGEFFYYRWTALPESVKSDNHEVLRRWPEALIYLAVEQAILITTKDAEQAMYWHNLFIAMDPKITSEFRKIKDYQRERKSKKRFDSSAHNGATTLGSRRDDQQKAWF